MKEREVAEHEPKSRIVNRAIEDARFVMQLPDYTAHAKVSDRLIDEGNYDLIPVEMITDVYTLPEWTWVLKSEWSRNKVIAVSIIGNAINFAYTNFETRVPYQRTTRDGSTVFDADAMYDALTEEAERNPGILTGGGLENLTIEDMERIFSGSNGTSLQMLEERRDNLKQLGQMVRESYHDNFEEIVTASDGKIFGPGGFIERLGQCDAYQDAYDIDANGVPRTVHADKRVQLVASEISGRLQKESSPFESEQVAALSVFADYILPMIAIQNGWIEVSDEFRQAIINGEVFEDTDPRIIALRFATIVAYDKVRQKINEVRQKIDPKGKQFPPIIAAALDAATWLRYHEAVGSSHPLIRTRRM